MIAALCVIGLIVVTVMLCRAGESQQGDGYIHTNPDIPGNPPDHR